MATVTMMVGIPASGKSTLAEQLSIQENAIILSSDALREELYGDINHQDSNGELFQELYRRAKAALSNGQNVIVDATNINQKRRIHFINEFIPFEKECIYISNYRDICILKDQQRRDAVGKYVIDRMYKGMQIPFKEEGWDKITYHLTQSSFPTPQYLELRINDKLLYHELFDTLNQSLEFRNIYELPHDSTYHSLSVSRHTYHVWDYIRENYEGEDRLVMLWTALLHDIGKAFCKEFKEGKRYANFISHENVSAQIAMNYLHRCGYDIDFITQVTKLVQLHMRLLNGGDKVEEKISSMYGQDVLDRLKFFREADTQAH